MFECDLGSVFYISMYTKSIWPSWPMPPQACIFIRNRHKVLLLLLLLFLLKTEWADYHCVEQTRCDERESSTNWTNERPERVDFITKVLVARKRSVDFHFNWLIIVVYVSERAQRFPLTWNCIDTIFIRCHNEKVVYTSRD